jgi:hypothetical protein
MENNNNMKYATYLNGQLVLSSDSITESVKKITDYVPNEMNGWNNFFKVNHGHIVNNESRSTTFLLEEEATIAWSSKIYNNGK